MATSILGLDIGGANLKAATPDKRALSVPFPLWKQPEKLPAALAELVSKFPDAEELAVTMTGELCDCFETKRDGVNAIIAAVRFASGARLIRVWSTDGAFLNSEEAKQNHMKVAAANWHALAMYAGRFVPKGRAILVDIGSTTTDMIPIFDGKPIPEGKTDPERLRSGELLYAGVRRTPVCAATSCNVARELFATTLDAYLVLGMIPEEPDNSDTADGRPATKQYAFDRLCRMLCGDCETIQLAQVESLANDVVTFQCGHIRQAFQKAVRPVFRERISLSEKGGHFNPIVLACGSGEFLALRVFVGHQDCEDVLSLGERVGPEVSACAPAYAVAVLATERRP